MKSWITAKPDDVANKVPQTKTSLNCNFKFGVGAFLIVVLTSLLFQEDSAEN